MTYENFHHFIVHQIKRDDNNNAILKTRRCVNRIDDMTNEVGSNLLDLFNKTGLQTGSFGVIKEVAGKDVKVSPEFEKRLKANCHKDQNGFVFDDFRQLTIGLARLLEEQMNSGPGKNAKPCFIVFFHHTIKEKSYLTVVTLLETKGFTLKALSFKYIERLDMDKLHLAARIRLDDWNDGIEERYISFRVGRNSEMRDYFKDFIGCDEFRAAKIETKNLVDALKKCCDTIYGHDETKRSKTLEDAEGFCKQYKDEEGKVDLIPLGKHLFPHNDNLLLETCQSDEFKLSDRVSIDNLGLRALSRYKGRDKEMNISFDADLLSSRVVEYEHKTGRLIFNRIPASLRESLNRK